MSMNPARKISTHTLRGLTKQHSSSSATLLAFQNTPKPNINVTNLDSTTPHRSKTAILKKEDLDKPIDSDEESHSFTSSNHSSNKKPTISENIQAQISKNLGKATSLKPNASRQNTQMSTTQGTSSFKRTNTVNEGKFNEN